MSLFSCPEKDTQTDPPFLTSYILFALMMKKGRVFREFFYGIVSRIRIIGLYMFFFNGVNLFVLFFVGLCISVLALIETKNFLPLYILPTQDV